MTSRERYQAECFRERPSFLDLFHYFAMINTGSMTEYRQFKEWINKEGDFAKMKLYSNWPAALRRVFEGVACIAVAHKDIAGVSRNDVRLEAPAFFYASIYEKWTVLIVKSLQSWF